MTLRVALSAVLATFLICGAARAAHPTFLLGSGLTTEEAVGKAETVFVGRLMGTGSLIPIPEARNFGPVFGGVRVKVLQVFRGSPDAEISVMFRVMRVYYETSPRVGATYVFLLDHATLPIFGATFSYSLSDGTTLDSVHPYPHVVKLLAADDANIALVKKLISK